MNLVLCMAFFLLSFVFVFRGGMRDTMLVTLAVGRIQYWRRGGGGGGGGEF